MPVSTTAGTCTAASVSPADAATALRCMAPRYDALPVASAPQLQEMPFYAVFRGIDIRQMEDSPRLMFVYVSDIEGPEVLP